MKLSDLPPIVRVLLTTDGTVTRSLHAYYQEEIKVQVLAQSVIHLDQQDTILGCEQGAEVCFRRVKLVGQNTDRVYAYAQTHLNLNVLPKEVSKALDRGEIGVGELLQLEALETHRAVLQHGGLEQLPSEFAEDFSKPSPVAWRHYSISHNLRTLMHIREFFPLVSFA